MSELKIIQEKENPLFNRKEIKGIIKAKSTPKKSEIEKILSKKFSSKLEVIDLIGIKNNFGTTEFRIEANIYANAKDKNEITRKSKKQRENEKKATEEAAKVKAEKVEAESKSAKSKPTVTEIKEEAPQEIKFEKNEESK